MSLTGPLAPLFAFDRTPARLADPAATAVDLLIEENRLHASGPNVYLP